MKKFSVLLLLVVTSLFSVAYALDSVPKTEYKTRRVALAGEIPGGVAVLFAATEPVLDFMPYRQDEDFYYLTGWNEPGAAIVLVAAAPAEAEALGTGLGGRPAQAYREILFLPTRNTRTEKYTGAKMDAATPGVTGTTGFDEVLPMTEMPAVLSRLAVADRARMRNVWVEKGSAQAQAALGFTASTLGVAEIAPAGDVAQLIVPLRAVKSAAEIALLKKASEASIAAQMAEMKAVRPGVTERKVAG